MPPVAKGLSRKLRRGLTAPSGVASHAVLLALGLYILSKPYYLLPSGLPQVADMLLMVGMAFLLFVPRPSRDAGTGKFMVCAAIFCAYAAIISVGWAFALMEPRVALNAAYYAFNLCLLILCLRVGELYPEVTLRIIAYAIALSAMVQAGTAALTFNAAEFRQIASFNNPNQFAYWSLLSLCIFWSISGRIALPIYLRAATLIALLYAIAISLSKAAIIAAVLLLVLHFLKRPKLMAVAIIVAVVGYLTLENSTIGERIAFRLENIGTQSDDSFYSRGYLRILRYPEYAVIGAGEGAIYRFDDTEYSDLTHEIHSTFGTILFCYGAVGTAAFAGALFYLYRVAGLGNAIYLAPPFLYGLTHQGIRFSFLWLFLAVLVLLGRITAMQKPPATSPSVRMAAGRPGWRRA